MGVEGLWFAVKPWAKPGNLFKLCTQACIGLDASLLLHHHVNALRHERFRAHTLGEMRSHVVQSVVGHADKLTGRGMSCIHVLDGLKNPAKVVAQSKRANVTQTLPIPVDDELKLLLISAFRRRGVTCYNVAQCEADAQLESLDCRNAVQCVVTTDGDAIIRRCRRVFRALNWGTGEGELYEPSSFTVNTRAVNEEPFHQVAPLLISLPP